MRPAFLALALLLAGCTGPGGTSPYDGGSPPGTTPPGPGPQEGPVTFERFEGCTSVQEQEQYVVVSSQAQWEALWLDACAEGQGGQPPPDVDFAQRSLVAAFWGQKQTGGFAVSVQAITVRAADTQVEVERVTPGPTCAVTSVLTYPADLVLAPKLAKPPTWTFHDRVEEC